MSLFTKDTTAEMLVLGMLLGMTAKPCQRLAGSSSQGSFQFVGEIAI